MSIKAVCRKNCSEDEIIQGVVDAASDFYDLSQANRYFLQLCESVCGFSKIGSNVYRYKDFFINVGKWVFMAKHADNLRIIADLELTFLPELAAYIRLNNAEDMVLFTKIDGSENHELLPCGNISQISHRARLNLLEDVDKMLEAGYALRAVTENPHSWYILEGKERIIFSACELISVPESAKYIYRKRILEILLLE